MFLFLKKILLKSQETDPKPYKSKLSPESMPKKKPFYAQASIWKRLAAFLVDMAIVNIIILFPFRNVLEKAIPDPKSLSSTIDFFMNQQGIGMTMMMLSVAFITILYFAKMERGLGQTPGKMLFSLYVMTQEKEASAWQFYVRSMFLIPIFPFVLLWIIDPIVIFFTSENRRLSEILSKTKTVEKYNLAKYSQ